MRLISGFHIHWDAVSFVSRHLEVTLYTQALHSTGWIAIWPQRSQRYWAGFVLRVLWLGFVLRVGGRRLKTRYPEGYEFIGFLDAPEH